MYALSVDSTPSSGSHLLSAILLLLLGSLVDGSSAAEECNYTSSKICEDKNEAQWELLCREDNRLVFKRSKIITIEERAVLLNFSVEFTQFNNGDNKYLLHRWIPYLQTDKQVFSVETLAENTSYVLRLKTSYKNGLPDSGWIIIGPYTTLPGNIIPGPLKDVNIDNFTNNNGSVSTILKWKPNDDMSCYTEVLQVHNDSLRTYSPFYVEMNYLYHFPLMRLEYSSFYIITVYTRAKEEQSEETTITFTTPSCLEATDNNMNICVPETPHNIKLLPHVEECKVTVAWDKAFILPDFYIVEAYFNSSFSNRKDYNISGNSSELTINLSRDIRWVDIEIIAVGFAGKSVPSFTSYNNTCAYLYDSLDESESYQSLLVIISSSSVALLLIVFMCILTYLIRSKKRVDKPLSINSKDYMIPSKLDQSEKSDKYTVIENKEKCDSPVSSDSCLWLSKELSASEIDPSTVVLCELLGKGEFGVVHRALLIDKQPPTEVAVKTIRDGGTRDDTLKLLSEGVVMAAVGQHKNIVSLIGCYWCGNTVYLIVEYCKRGDLLNYLRMVSRFQPWVNWSNPAPKTDFSLIAVSNALYLSEDAGIANQFSTKDLLSFARQIALGMEYLSENRVIHRDLAARNILLCGDMTVKISDFGLSRDVYETSVYHKQSSDRLPLKWMALESLSYQVFTSKSDVWSFGIVLWEMATLGECPYPSIATCQVLKLLKEGYRMERPICCSQKLYDVMLSCWEGDPNRRPCFTSLVQRIDDIIALESESQYLQLKSGSLG